jgi:energy-coupling factor transporter ATP-binding protein EcfA2
MELPQFKHVTINAVFPVSLSGTIGFPIKSGINLFIRPNGQGKTTLADLLECGLLGDTNGDTTLTQKAMNNKSFVALTFAIGGQTYANWRIYLKDQIKIYFKPGKEPERAINKRRYLDDVESLTELPFTFIKDFYNFCVYMREDHVFLPISENQRFSSFLKYLNSSVYPSFVGLTTHELDSLRMKRKKTIENIKKLNKSLKALNDREKVIKDLSSSVSISDSDKELVIAEIKRLEERKAELVDAIFVLNKKQYDLYNDYMEKYRVLSEKEQELSGISSNIEFLAKSMKDLTKQENNVVEKQKNLLSEFEVCHLCGTSLEETWNKRIVQGKCPVCAFNLDEDDPLMKKLIEKKSGFLIDDREKQKEKQNQLRFKKEGLQEKQLSLSKELNVLREKVNIVEKNRNKVRTDLKELNDQLSTIEKELKEKQQKHAKITQLVQLQLLHKETSADEEADLNNRTMELEKQKLQFTKELQQKQNGLVGKIEEIKLRFEKYVRDLSTKLFTVPLTLNLENWKIEFLEDAEPQERAVMALASSERYFIDFLMRVSFQKLFIEYGLLSRGFLVLDSPETAIDSNRLQALAKILDELAESFDIIICTTNDSIKTLLASHRILTLDYPKTNLLKYFSS